jgi:hypothetical protein
MDIWDIVIKFHVLLFLAAILALLGYGIYYNIKATHDRDPLVKLYYKVRKTWFFGYILIGVPVIVLACMIVWLYKTREIPAKNE